MSHFFHKIEHLEKVKNFENPIEHKESNIAFFEFDGFHLSATQTLVRDVCISRIISRFSFKNNKTKNKKEILEAINNLHNVLPLVKIFLKEVNSQSIDLNFALEYSYDDIGFDKHNISTDLNILVTASALLEDILIKGNDQLISKK